MRMWTLIFGCALVASCLLLSTARADRLDQKMLEGMDKLVDQLQEKYEAVGVLPFRVQIGRQPERFNVPLCSRLVERLEMMLVVYAGPTEEKALGVLGSPAAVADKAKILDWYRKVEDRKALFQLKYPLAWGNKTVKADAFLTGKMTVSEDLQQATLNIECFDKNKPEKVVVLRKISVPMDRFLLRDLGLSFRLSDKSIKSLVATRGLSQKQIDERLREDISTPERRTDVKPADVTGIALEMLVGERKEEFREISDTGSANWVVDCPPVGSKIAFRLTNTRKDEDLAVVLRLNGLNVINEEMSEPDTGTKFVIRAGKSIRVDGFLLPSDKKEEKKVAAFKVIEGDEAARFRKSLPKNLVDRTGTIELIVFRKQEVKPEESLFITRGIPPTKKDKAKESYLGLKDAYLKNLKLVTKQDIVTKREIIVKDEKELHRLEGKYLDDFPTAFQASLSIKVLPRSNEIDHKVAKQVVATDPFAATPRDLRKYHILMVFDTNDPKLKKPLEIDRVRMENLWKQTIPAHLRDVTIMTGDEVTRQKILQYYSRLDVKHNEGILFFYGGHGAIDPGSKEHYFQMADGNFKRSELRQAMMAKNAGMVVLLSDCCSSPIAIDRSVKPIDRQPFIPRGIVGLHPTVRALLFRSRGLADITAATDNAAWCDILEGGLFTRTVANMFNPQVISDMPQMVDWGEFTRKLSDETEYLFQNWREEMRTARGIEIKEKKQRPFAFHNIYAVVGMGNATVLPLNYRYRWSDEKAWTTGKIEPGKKFALTRQLSPTGGIIRVPRLELQINSGETQTIEPAEYTGMKSPTYEESSKQIVYRELIQVKPGK